MLDPSLYETLLDRLKLPSDDGCWEWKGARNGSGYGTIYINRKRQFAHRAMWQAVKGPIGAGQVICHSCDNPACVRPDHLFAGSLADNNRDRHAKGRSVHGGRRPRITAHWNAPLNFADVWTDQCEPEPHDLRDLGA